MNKFRNIMMIELELLKLKKMFDIAQIAGNKVVHRNNMITFLYEAITKMRAEKAGPTGNDGGGHRRDATRLPRTGRQTLRGLYRALSGRNVYAMETRRHKHLVLILARELASNLATPTLIADADGTLVFYNEAAGTLLGKRFEELGTCCRRKRRCGTSLNPPCATCFWRITSRKFALRFSNRQNSSRVA